MVIIAVKIAEKWYMPAPGAQGNRSFFYIDPWTHKGFT